MAFKNASESNKNLTLSELEAKKSELLSFIGELGVTIEGMEAQVASHKDLSAEIETAKEKIKQLKLEEKEVKREIALLKDQSAPLDSAVRKLTEVSLDYATLQDKVADIQAEIKVWENKKREISQEYSSHCGGLKANIADITRELEAKQAEITALQSKKHLAESELAGLTASIIQKKDEISFLNADVSRLIGSIKNLQAQETSLLASNTALTNAGKEEVEALTEKKKEINKSIDRKMEELSAKEAEYEKRNGDLSLKERFFEGKVERMRDAKVRIESHLGEPLDINF